MFQVGDKVKIRSLDEVLEIEGVDEAFDLIGPTITRDMLDTFGKTGTIISMSNDGYWRVSLGNGIDIWYYNSAWLTHGSPLDSLLDYVDYLDLQMNVNDDRVIVSDFLDRILVVVRKTPFKMRCDYDTSKITIDEMHKLVELAIDYSAWVERRYKLRLPELFSTGNVYLNYIIDEERFYFGSDYESPNYKTEFTLEEISNLPNQDFVQALEKELVE